MNVNFSVAFDGLRSYLASEIPDFTSVVTRWVDYDKASDGLAMLIPHSNHTEDGKITLNVNVWYYTVKPNVDDVIPAQVAAMEKLFNAVYRQGGVPFPTLKASVVETEYQNDLSKPQNMGRSRALVEMILEFDDNG